MVRIIAITISIGIMIALASIPAVRALVSSQPAVTENDVQCGHWCVVRCSELLGAPVSVIDVVKLMPPTPAGHNLHQLSQTLEKIGLQCTGRQERFEALQNREGPWIVHLKNPDHFIVLVSVETNEGRIHAFDPLGKRETIPMEQVRTRWSGRLLEVGRVASKAPLPLYVDRPRHNPSIQFQKLFIDKGSVYANGQLATFEFPFANLGETPLSIQNVRPSCSCLIVDYTREPVPAGGTGAVTVRVNPGNNGGGFLHSLDVETNDPVMQRLRLQASGYVATDVLINPPTIDLGNVLPGTTVRRQCFIQYHNNTTRLRLSDVALQLPGAEATWIEQLNEADNIDKVWPGAGRDVDLSEGVSVIQITYTAPASASGKISTAINARSNIEGFEEIRVPVTGRVSPPITFIPSILSFGEVDVQASSAAKVRVRSTSAQAFQILTVELAGAQVEWKVTTVSEDLQELTVTMPGHEAAGFSGQSLDVKIKLGDSSDVSISQCPIYATARR